MNRVLLLVIVAIGLVAAACGNGASAANSSTSPTPNPGAQFRNGASGQLVQVNGQSLILTGPNGDLTVAITGGTTFTRTSTAVLADIVPGQCLVATGQKDSAGLLVAMTVRLSPKTASGCAAAPNRVGPSPAPGASPRPIPSGQPAQAFVTGEVTGAAGVSITVLTTGSGSQTITVPTTATVTRMLSASATDLQTGQCIRANGSRDSAGTVQATSIAITPAGPSGTCTAGFGGRGPGRAGASPGAPAPNN
jgi:Domain of unknown function (DUF5666)